MIDVTDSPIVTPTWGPFAMEFRDAAERAVRSWRFAPSFRQWIAEGGDLDGDGQLDYGRWMKTSIPVFLDVQFQFEIVGGKGTVEKSAFVKDECKGNRCT